MGGRKTIAACAAVWMIWALGGTAGAQELPEAPRPSAADLEAVQRAHAGEADFCLERERSLRPDAAGVVVVDFGLDGEGHPLASTVLSSTFETGNVIDGCLRAAVARWTFPAPRRASAHYALTFVLGLGPPARAAPVALAPVIPSVSWELRVELVAPAGMFHRALGRDEERALDTEMGAGLTRARSDLEACFIAAADGEAMSFQLEIQVPGGGDILMIDVTLRVARPGVSETALLRCVRPVVARIEARSSTRNLMVRWSVRVTHGS